MFQISLLKSVVMNSLSEQTLDFSLSVIVDNESEVNDILDVRKNFEKEFSWKSSRQNISHAVNDISYQFEKLEDHSRELL